MNDKKLIKEYIKIVLQEGAFRRGVNNHRYGNYPNVGKGSILGTIKGFFSGRGPEDKIAKEWIEEYELLSNGHVSGENVKDIISFAKEIYPKILKLPRIDGDKDKAAAMTTRQISDKFSQPLKNLPTTIT